MTQASTHPIGFELNGRATTLTCQGGERLLDTLRNQGLWSVKHGCETGDCGACTVLVDGVPRASCLMLTAQVDGRAVATVESLGSAEQLHPLQQQFVDRGAIQCGFCTPGMLLSAKALLDANPCPTQEDAKDALSGNLCRCTGYCKPVEAILGAAEQLHGSFATSS